jgi:hypothetical protein
MSVVHVRSGRLLVGKLCSGMSLHVHVCISHALLCHAVPRHAVLECTVLSYPCW